MRIDWFVTAVGAAAVGVALAIGAAGPAAATFAGSSNGNVAFVAICDSNIGQAVYSVNPNGSPPPTYTCPGGRAPNYTQSTAGATDSMPYFSSGGNTLYFSSNRGPATSTSPFALYSVAYPATVSGVPGAQTDSAIKLTNPVAANDYAPTVSADGSRLAFIRCDSSSSSCHLFTMALLPSLGSPVQVASAALRPPDPVSGAANRPEIDPADTNQILYVDSSSHIHVLNLTTAADRDLSTESGVGPAKDEYPDWNPAGTKIAFDSTRSSGTTIWEMDVTTNPATASQLWAKDPGTEIEPIFAPSGTALVWTKLGNGSNIIEYSPDAKMSHQQAVATDPLTQNRTNNSQPAWQPLPLGPQLPEAPYAVLLPGGALLMAGIVVGLRRRRSAIN